MTPAEKIQQAEQLLREAKEELARQKQPCPLEDGKWVSFMDISRLDAHFSGSVMVSKGLNRFSSSGLCIEIPLSYNTALKYARKLIGGSD